MKKIIYLFIVLTLSGCATTRVVMSEYLGRKYPGKSMGLIADKINVNNPKDVNDDLGEGLPEEVFNDYFQYTFARYTLENSNLSVATFPNKVDKTNFEETILMVTEKDSLKIALPPKGSVLQTQPVYFDYILVIDELEVSKNWEMDVRMALAMGSINAISSTSKGFLAFKYNYTIWDNGQKQVLAYGKDVIKREYTFALTKNIWDAVIIDMTKRILKDTPFDNFTGKFTNFKRNKQAE